MPGQPTNQGEQPLLTVDVVAGVDGTSAPYLLNPKNLVDCTNFLPDQGYGALTTALGRGVLPGLDEELVLPGPCRGIGLFHRYNPYTITPSVYVFAIDYEGAGTLWYIRDDGVGGLQQLLLGVGNTLTAGQQTFFAEAGVWLFVSNGTDTPLKIDNALTVTQWGIVPPPTTPQLAGAQGGKLSYGQSPYYYCVTFGVKKTGVTAPGQESSQGKISQPYTMSQTPATGSVTIDSSISGIGAGYNFQFTLRVGGADYPYGAVYTTISTESAENAAHQIAVAINAAYPLAYTKGQKTGTLTVTATTSLIGGNSVINISIADSNGAAIDTAGYVKYYVDDLHAPSGGPYHCDPNQSDPGNASGGQTDNAIQLTNIPISPDPQVTERNIYRLGGALGQWRLVDTLPDNLVTSYLDITADTDLTGQALVVYRDPPPPFAYICGHQQRIFGLNTLHAPEGSPNNTNNSSSLWWSNYAEPWGFNALQNVLTVGQALEGDPGVGMASIGSMMGICKRYGFYGLYGNSDATWASGLFKISDTGCSSARSICAAYGMMGWVSRQGGYLWNGMGLPNNLTDGNFQQSNIKNVFDQTSLDQLKLVVGFWYARMLAFSFASTGRTYLYDPRSQGWWPLPYFTEQALYDIESDTPIVALRGGSPTNVDAWFQSGTDLGQPLVATGVTRVSGDPDMSWVKILQHLLVDAPVTTAMFSYQFVCDDGAQQTVWPPVPTPQTNIDFSQGLPRHRVSTQLIEFVDMQLQFSLTTTMPGTIINRIAASGVQNRQYAPESQSDQ
jgi:hypothetical protein